jgi:fatty acid desaturase
VALVRGRDQAEVAARRGLLAQARDLAGVTTRLAFYNVGYLALTWVIAIGAIAVFWTYRTWWTFTLAYLVVSSRQQALLNCEHEAQHRKFLPNLRWNNFVGTYLCAAAVGSPYEAARTRHLTHHRLVGTADDPDRHLYSGDDKRTVGGLMWYFARGLIGAYAGMVLMGPKAPKAATEGDSPLRDLMSLAVTQSALAIGLTLAFDWWVYPALWLAPLATVTALCHLVRSFSEHAINDEETPRHDNRLITIRSNLLERSLVAPYFMNYHAEHHLLPSVPAPRLAEFQRRISETSDIPPVLVRRSYADAIRGYATALLDRTRS